MRDPFTACFVFPYLCLVLIFCFQFRFLLGEMDSLLRPVDLGPLTNLSLPTALIVQRVASLSACFRLLVSARDTARARARSFDIRPRTLALYCSAATDFHMR